MPRYLLLLLVLCLGACTLPKVDPAREAQVDQTYELVRRSDAEGLKAIGSPGLVKLNLGGPLREMQAHIHASAPTRVETVSWSSFTTDQSAQYEVIRLYSHPEGDVQVRVLMLREGDADWKVDGVNAVRITAAARQAYDETIEAARFTLKGKSPVHYLVLIGASLSAMLCVVSAAMAGFRRRWVWMIGCLFGVCKLSLNWTTGAIFFQPIYVSLLGAGFLKGLGPIDPWVLSVAIPLPALLFWALGKWRPKPPKRKPEADMPAGPDARWSDS